MNIATTGALWVLAVLLLFPVGDAHAMNRAQTADGRAFVSGGIGQAEVKGLEAERDKYSLWVITAARVSGAYLSDVPIRIVDAANRTVFDRKLDGPWLLIDLAPGKYIVEATYRGQTQRRTTSIQHGDHHQVVFHFDSDADVLPASPPASK